MIHSHLHSTLINFYLYIGHRNKKQRIRSLEIRMQGDNGQCLSPTWLPARHSSRLHAQVGVGASSSPLTAKSSSSSSTSMSRFCHALSPVRVHRYTSVNLGLEDLSDRIAFAPSSAMPFFDRRNQILITHEPPLPHLLHLRFPRSTYCFKT